MRSDILKYIAQLSLEDKKSLSQKVLKLFEEGGELAQASLSFDNAFGANHRFSTAEKVLEESVDSILVALSVVYSLGFSDEDLERMMKQKTDKWAELQSRESRLKERTPFEIHVTVAETPDLESFRKVCAGLDVKPIVLDLHTQSQDVIKDIMTSSVFFGGNKEAYLEMTRISKGLAEAGYKVVRNKIETVPWHPAAPSRTNLTPRMPESCYFECHFNVRVQGEERRALLSMLARDEECHLSKNAFKKYEDGSEMIMMTYRSYDKVYEDVRDKVDHIVAVLSAQSFDVEKEIVEFSIYDSKTMHDAAWIAADA